jgi:glycosyltransferase involved in cell wall biosynthesis
VADRATRLACTGGDPGRICRPAASSSAASATSPRPSECRTARFTLLRERVPEALLLLVGALSPGLEPELPEGAVHHDYVDEERLWSLLAASDVSVSLRWPTMGETSAIVVRALSLGRPLVVSDVGWFADLPAEVAVKVPVGGDEVEVLADTLESLARDPVRRGGTGRQERTRRGRARPGACGRGIHRGARGSSGRRGGATR